MLSRAECRLRPVAEGDLDRVLKWRNTERIRSLMYTDHPISMEEHRAWFEITRGGEIARCLIFEYRGEPLGVVNLSDLDRRNGKCHWGFYVGPVDAPRGSGSAMAYFALEHIFETLQFRKLIGEAFAFNQGSIDYHLRLGFKEEGHFVKHVLKNGTFQDVISFALFADQWQGVKRELRERCFGD